MYFLVSTFLLGCGKNISYKMFEVWVCFSHLGLVLSVGALGQTAILSHPCATQVHKGGTGSGLGGLSARRLLPECQGHSQQGLCPSPAPCPYPGLSSSESSWWFLISLLVSILIPLPLFFPSLILIPLRSRLERWRPEAWVCPPHLVGEIV